MNPKVVSDPDKFSDKFDAAETFIDYLVDKRGIPRNFWSGKDKSEAHFVYDLGCEANVTEVHLRNSHGGKGTGEGYLRLVHVMYNGGLKSGPQNGEFCSRCCLHLLPQLT